MGGARGFSFAPTSSWKMLGADFAGTGLRESAPLVKAVLVAPASLWKRKTFTLLANLSSFIWQFSSVCTPAHGQCWYLGLSAARAEDTSAVG